MRFAKVSLPPGISRLAFSGSRPVPNTRVLEFATFTASWCLPRCTYTLLATAPSAVDSRLASVSAVMTVCPPAAQSDTARATSITSPSYTTRFVTGSSREDAALPVCMPMRTRSPLMTGPAVCVPAAARAAPCTDTSEVARAASSGSGLTCPGSFSGAAGPPPASCCRSREGRWRGWLGERPPSGPSPAAAALAAASFCRLKLTCLAYASAHISSSLGSQLCSCMATCNPMHMLNASTGVWKATMKQSPSVITS
mmetsp:Transcript_25110/g.85970  ORF Transcript_25110/g.85970 Transcript_25110/m.85970 type:complete len:254 (-) Transcript_25110:1355-2116(-)